MGVWVKVPQSEQGGHYFWNPADRMTSWTLPTGEECCWQTQATPDGRTYFWNTVTRETVWDAPQYIVPAGGRGCNRCEMPDSGLQDRDYVRPEKGWQFSVWNPGPGVPPSCPNSEASAPPSGRPWSAEGRSSWIEVEANGVLSHLWNFESGLAVVRVPQGLRARWKAFAQADGTAYFVEKETGLAQWALPGMRTSRKAKPSDLGSACGNARWITVDAAMLVTGLTKDSRFNGQVVQVWCFQDGRVHVLLPECLGGAMLSLRPEHLEPLTKGTLVEFRGLSQSELNGEVGTVDSVDHNECLYLVQTRDRLIKPVKGTEVRGRSRLWDLNLTSHRLWLQWRKEQFCLFIDSSGFHKKYSIHLPLTFAAKQNDALHADDPSPKWPVLIYLHGTGGGSFFTHAKKTLRSEGLQYAATQFVIVSPQCDWNWREMPKPWVTELVANLRAATWVDHTRIYLTGSSMGGMSTWEIGAQMPDFYAAIAPVAAHHNQEREDIIAGKLQNTPVFVVHSELDETCPMNLEKPLWERLDRKQVNLAKDVDHCSMYERAYCDDTTLYDWLLRYKQKPR